VPRPPKNVKVLTNRISKAEKQKRLEVEEKLKGNADDLKPPKHLNANQKKIYRYIVSELEASKVLSNLDSFILETYSIAVDRLQSIEKEINRDFQLLMDKALMSSKSKYTSDFFKCCAELSLSPSSRAKFGILSTQKMEDDQDPLLKVLSGGKNDTSNLKTD
jgi:P27 family predicted phage terminase small subunit